jgi:cell division protein FtsN
LGKYQTYLQVGAFSSRENARNFEKKINRLGFETIIFSKMKKGKNLFVVAAGPFSNGKVLKKATDKLRENNINFFVIKR